MQQLRGQTEAILHEAIVCAVAVFDVTNDRESRLRQMRADLVRPAGDDLHLDQRKPSVLILRAAKRSDDCFHRLSLVGVLCEHAYGIFLFILRHFGPHPHGLLEFAADDRQIQLAHHVLGTDHPVQLLQCRRVFAEDHQSGRIAVQTVRGRRRKGLFQPRLIGSGLDQIVHHLIGEVVLFFAVVAVRQKPERLFTY